MRYPLVLNEFSTIDAVASGMSIARFGDGELKVVYGYGYVREEPNTKLTQEIREVLLNPHPTCLIAIPTMDPAGPKYENWIRHQRRFSRVLSPKRVYMSAFISRPDSSPWINTLDYAQRAQKIWAGKRVVIVSEAKNSLLHTARLAAHKTTHVGCPRFGAYAVIDELEEKAAAAYDGKPDVILISAGVTATCLANRLAKRGLHAVDLGSAGGFLYKLLNPKEKK